MSTGTGTATGRYLPYRQPSGARPRLFCFHHAGGAASAYLPWIRALAPDVDVLPVQLPGREGRIREPRVSDLDALVADLLADLGEHLDGPHTLYGHSMGALVAYRLALASQAAGLPPSRLIVSGLPAPHLPAAHARAADRSDAELIGWMTRIGGMSAALTGYPDWQAAQAMLVRDDLRLCASHRAALPAARLTCPVHVFLGDRDPLTGPAQARAWRLHTDAGCTLRTLPGGHFFDAEATDTLLRLVRSLAGTSRPHLARRPLATAGRAAAGSFSRGKPAAYPPGRC